MALASSSMAASKYEADEAPVVKDRAPEKKKIHYFSYLFFREIENYSAHSLIRGVLIQSCSAEDNFTNYVFCHPQFSGVIQNIENFCAMRAKF